MNTQPILMICRFSADSLARCNLCVAPGSVLPGFYGHQLCEPAHGRETLRVPHWFQLTL